MKSFLFIASFCLALTQVAYSQNETKKWYFGQQAGLDFMTSPPTIIVNSAMTTQEGCASIANAAGNTLFYTDGLTVWNAANAIMANGTGLNGNQSSTQSGVIVKQPGNSNIYYVFTMGTNGPFCYSTVDMLLAAGMGSVTTKNVLLFQLCTEKLTSVRHCNGVDVWVIAHERNSNNFRAHLVTALGVNPTAVVTTLGSSYTDGRGHLRTSPNGKKIAVAEYSPGAVELFDFDNSTGVVSNQLVLASLSSPYGLEFSPDGTKLYCTREGGANNKIYQWDLCAGSSTAVIASMYTISTTPGVQVFAMQMATNGKIYVTRYNQTDLGIINNPNVYGAGCNYVDIGQSVAPKMCRLGLPNFITSLVKPVFTFSAGQGCATVSFTAPASPTVINGCVLSGNSITGLLWNFGDPPSGAANSSTLVSPIHNYPQGGTYTVQLITTSACGNDTIRLPVTVVSPSVSFVAAPNVTQATCSSTNNAFNLGLTFSPPSPAPGYTITWSTIPNGVTSPTQTSASGTIAPGVYVATISIGGGCASVASFTVNNGFAPPTFTINPSYTITCAQPNLSLTLDPANNYTWVSTNSPSLTGSNVVLTSSQTGTWTINAAGGGSCVATKTFVVAQNTLAPTSAISPTFQNITCSLTSINTVTASSNLSVNITHLFISAIGSTLTANTQTAFFTPGAPSNYTHCVINNANGCSSCKTFTVFSTSGFPTFSVSSPQNFTLGCSSKSVANINITGAQTTPTAGGPVSYTILGPPTSTATPPGSLSAISSYTVNAPGTWTVITKDNTNLCESKVFVSVLQNTVGPGIDSLIIPRNILDCNYPSSKLEGMSLTPNVSYVWGFPGTPGTLNSNTITVVTNSLSPTTTLVANYTLTITDNNNTCRSSTVVPILQNIFPPKAAISNGGTGAITCNTGTITLTNNSTSGIPPTSIFPISNPVIGFIWDGPTPQQQGQVSSTYLAATVGEYTLTVKDLNNGCLSKTVTSIGDGRQYPVVNEPIVPAPSVLDCGAPFTRIMPIVTTGTGALTYSWVVPPTASVSGASTPTLNTNEIGDYWVIVTNTLNGCATTAYMSAIDGTLRGNIAVSDSTGFAPLSITIENKSSSTLNSNSITTVWSFGNGTSSVTASASIIANTIYNQPGNYTITAYMAKGACLDTVVQVIHVESVSELKVPNIFTPNGDNVNDLFFLKATNLIEINIIIYDRWGHMVYELKSDKGNIAWDGKNQLGKEVPDGTYFYFLKATGSDGKKFDTKGNLTILR